jgi:hypothetical protein
MRQRSAARELRNENTGRTNATTNHESNMKSGNGKIANLPSHLRDELNYRIADGDPGNELVTWLNSHPEVARVISERFDGTPISEQNLSEWRKRGYQKWLAHRNMFDESNALSDNAEGIAETGIDCDKLLLTLTAAYAEMIRNWIVTPCEQMTYKLAVYKNLTNGVIALRRAEIQKVRLEIERERLELLREKRGNKSGSSASSCVSASADSASPEVAASTNPARHEAPEPGRPPIPAPPPCDQRDLPAPPLSTLEGSPANAGSSPKVEAPALPDATVISQNIASPHPVPAPAHATSAPRPNSNAHPTARRASVPQNAPPGTVISLNPLRIVQKPALHPASGAATQATSYNPTAAPKPSAPKVVLSQPTPHR